ncbi:MAG: hypothetical protein ACLU9S_15280, partial [Oscillospiraceae bacterium]
MGKRHVIRKMNNQVRRDSGGDGRCRSTTASSTNGLNGKYLSGFTKDIRPDRKLGMGAIFQLDQRGFDDHKSLMRLSCC